MKWLPRLAIGLAIIAALLLLAAGPGTRMSIWDFRFGFKLFAWAAFTGLAAAAIAFVMLLIGRLRRAHGVMLGAALLLGIGVAFVPWNGMREAKKVPPIHDISTDTTNPPAFVAILPLRADVPNPATYGGTKIAEQQARLKELEQKKLEAENSEIVEIVRGMSISLADLPLVLQQLRSGASGHSGQKPTEQAEVTE